MESGTQSFDDDFMQISFKVEPCMLSHPHGWKMCPFVHPGEPVKRRHPSTHRGDMCNAVKKGQSCEAGDSCVYAHNSHELWLHPSRFKTKMCRSGAACARGICFFAHSEAELRQKGSTKQGMLNPSVPADASPAPDTAEAAGGAVMLTASPSRHLQAAGSTGATSSAPLCADMLAPVSGSGSSVAISSSASPCLPAPGALSAIADYGGASSSASSSCTSMYNGLGQLPCSQPAAALPAVPALAGNIVYSPTASQPAYSEQVYAQQCIDQLQQEVQQHLVQLQQSRMQEQMLAAALQQRPAGAVTYSGSGALQGSAAMSVPSPALSMQPSLGPLTSSGLAFNNSNMAAQPAGLAASAATTQLQAVAASQMMLPSSQLFWGGSGSSSAGGPYWLLASGELQQQPQHQQQQMLMLQPQQLPGQRWVVNGTGGLMQM